MLGYRYEYWTYFIFKFSHVTVTKPRKFSEYTIFNKNMANRGIHTWSFNISHIKTSLDYNNSYRRNNKFNPIFKKLKQRFQSAWLQRIHNDQRKNSNERNKLRTYRNFKNLFMQEAYLDILKDFRTRSNFCKFRISAHNLHIETGRHTNTKLENRLCKKM